MVPLRKDHKGPHLEWPQMVTALLVKMASRSQIGQNGHTILVKRATYSRIAIKRVNVTLFWSKPSRIRITTKTATDF